MQIIQREKSLVSGLIAVFMLSLMGMLWAETPDQIYNRPEPLMDYVPQEIGIFDGDYSSQRKGDCRVCHGDSTAERHHYSDLALTTRLCTPCHLLDPETPGGVLVENDCTVGGCHNTADRGSMDGHETPPNGWHHATDLALVSRCSACHVYPLIDHIADDAPLPFNQYPPAVVTPTPKACENCHWEQPVIANTSGWNAGDGPPFPSFEQAGHPSTYEHNRIGSSYNIFGSQTPDIAGDEYFEYQRRIESNRFTHHMLQHANSSVDTNCVRCHSQDPNDPGWDPADHELIRFCETCHDTRTIHAIEPHMGDGASAVNGWEAAGFHVPDIGNTDSTDVAPTVYRLYTGNEQCSGCHMDCLPHWMPPEPEDVPQITDITPEVGTWNHSITLTGEHFGSEKSPDRSVRVQSTSGGDWSPVPTRFWTDTQIQFAILFGTHAGGNYRVWVETEVGASNVVAFTLTDGDCNPVITPIAGKCREIITVSCQSVLAQDIFEEISGEGMYRSVEIVDPSSGMYVASAYGAWTAIDFKFRFGDVFEDVDNDYLRDPGESLICLCEGFPVGAYDIFIKDIHYQDTDGSNDYSEGDRILDINTKGPMDFTLEGGLALYVVSPRNIERSHYCPDGTLINGVAKITGWGFGATQGTGTVFIGTGPMYASDSGFALNRVVWSDNLIKVGVDVPPGAKGKNLYLWVEKDGQKTDASYGWPGIQILTSETCP